MITETMKRIHERLAKIEQTKEIGYYAKFYAEDMRDIFLVLKMYQENITHLQTRGTELISDQRELKGLLRRALVPADVGVWENWDDDVKRALERMK